MSALRLYLLGSLESAGSSFELTVLAEHGRLRSVEHVSVGLDSVEQLRRAVRHLRSFAEGGGPPFTNRDLETLGAGLFRLVIRDKVLRVWDASRTGKNRPVEVIAEDPEIAGWPWEFLYDDGTH